MKSPCTEISSDSKAATRLLGAIGNMWRLASMALGIHALLKQTEQALFLGFEPEIHYILYILTYQSTMVVFAADLKPSKRAAKPKVLGATRRLRKPLAEP